MAALNKDNPILIEEIKQKHKRISNSKIKRLITYVSRKIIFAKRKFTKFQIVSFKALSFDLVLTVSLFYKFIVSFCILIHILNSNYITALILLAVFISYLLFENKLKTLISQNKFIKNIRPVFFQCIAIAVCIATPINILALISMLFIFDGLLQIIILVILLPFISLLCFIPICSFNSYMKKKIHTNFSFIEIHGVATLSIIYTLFVLGITFLFHKQPILLIPNIICFRMISDIICFITTFFLIKIIVKKLNLILMFLLIIANLCFSFFISISSIALSIDTDFFKSFNITMNNIISFIVNLDGRYDIIMLAACSLLPSVFIAIILLMTITIKLIYDLIDNIFKHKIKLGPYQVEVVCLGLLSSLCVLSGKIIGFMHNFLII